MQKDDFFEETSGKRKAEAKKGSKKTIKESPNASSGMVYTVNLYLAIGLIVAAFVGGFLVRDMVWSSADTPPVATEENTQVSPPPLSQEQIEQGQIPQGHPQIPSSETGTPSETDTASSDAPSPGP